MLDDMNLKCNIKVDDDSLNYSHIEGYLKNFNVREAPKDTMIKKSKLPWSCMNLMTTKVVLTKVALQMLCCWEW